jgi:hypothetical protein
MRRLLLTASAAICSSLFGIAPATAADDEVCEAMYVHTANEASMTETTLTMSGVSPSVVFFCDRPVRFAGHMSIDAFLEEVSQAEESFAEVPPNAVVSIFVDGKDPQDVVFEIATRPEIDGETFVYNDIRILEGDVVAGSGPATIFIDRVGRPMSPGSVAGVHRRHVRRDVRRCATGRVCY